MQKQEWQTKCVPYLIQWKQQRNYGCISARKTLLFEIVVVWKAKNWNGQTCSRNYMSRAYWSFIYLRPKDFIFDAIVYWMTWINRYFSGFFKCENNVQINSKLVCNGKLDCKWTRPINPLDVSDEKNCCKFSPRICFLLW